MRVPCALCLLALLTPAAPADDRLFPIKEGGKWGFIDAGGTVRIRPQFESARPSTDGLAPAQQGGRWGYVDPAGRWAIQPAFDWAEPFRDGMAAVQVGKPFKGEGAFGYIDRRGEWVLRPNPRLSSCGFDASLMPFEADGLWGYLDPKGDVVAPATLRHAASFREGFARITDEGGEAFLDACGRLAFRPPPVRDLYNDFAEGLCCATDAKTGKIGYFDKTGRWAIPPQFHRAESFAEGLAAVCKLEDDATGWPTRKWGFIDKTGAVIIPYQYKSVGDFHEGRARVEVDTKYGFIDRSGRTVIPPAFDWAEPFANGLARVEVGRFSTDGWDGYIDHEGRFVWRPSDYRDRDARRLAAANKPPTVRLMTDPADKGEGILVFYKHKIEHVGDDAGTFHVTLVNHYDQDVFIESVDFPCVWFDLEPPDQDFVIPGGGSGPAITMGPRPFRLLHAATHTRDGRRLNCGCGAYSGSIKVPADVMALGRARGHASLSVSGIYRSNGAAFHESIELPVELLAPPPKP